MKGWKIISCVPSPTSVFLSRYHSKLFILFVLPVRHPGTDVPGCIYWSNDSVSPSVPTRTVGGRDGSS